MPYLRPPLFVRRVFNPLAMRFSIGGAQVLEVRRRRSGLVQRVPVIPVDHEGATYLVSPRGETDWVRNLRVSGTCRLGRHGKERECTVTELPADGRDAVIHSYRKVAGRAVKSFFEALPDARDHPVFIVTTRDRS